MQFRNPLRAKLRANTPSFGIFSTLEDPTITEIAADAGLDRVCIDVEHYQLDFRDPLNHLRAAQGGDRLSWHAFQ
jgi:4-hydroxy-2-oxoheptanedioate aldolase